MPKKRRAEEYDNDEGSPAARNKKVKKDTSATKKKAKDVADGSGEGKGKINNKKKKSSTEGVGKKNVSGDGERDSKGEEFWEVSFFFFGGGGGGGETWLSSSARGRGKRGKEMFFFCFLGADMDFSISSCRINAA